MSQPKKGKLGAVAKVVGAAQDLINETAPITSAYTPLKAADRAAAGNAAAKGIADEELIKASEALGRARERGYRKVTQTQADRTRVGGGNIGGPQFSALSLYDPNYAGRVWGVMDEGTASRLKNLSDPEHVFTTMLGSPDQLKTNPVVFDKLKRQFMREVKAGNLPPELLAKINAKLAQARSGKEGPALFGEGVDILDPDLWRNLDTFEKRAAVADMMRGEGVGGLSRYRMTKKGDRTIGGTIFDAPEVLRGETDPMLLHPEMGGSIETFSVGPRLFSLKGTSEYRPDMHPGFPTLLHGEDLGVKYNPVPSEVFLPDWYEEWKAAPNKEGNKKSAAEIKRGPGYYPLALGMEGRGLPSQAITDEYIRHLIREGYADGGEVQGGLAHMASGGQPDEPMAMRNPVAVPTKTLLKPDYSFDVNEPTNTAADYYASPAYVSPSLAQKQAEYLKLLAKVSQPIAKPAVVPAPKPVPVPVPKPVPVAKASPLMSVAKPVVAPRVEPPVAKPAPVSVMRPGLSKLSTSIFQKGGEVHAAPGGNITSTATKQIPSSDVMKAILTSKSPPAPAPQKPLTVSPMRMREMQDTINIVPPNPQPARPAPVPYVQPKVVAPAKTATSTIVAPTGKALTGPQFQGQMAPVSQQRTPVVKTPQPSVAKPAPAVSVPTPSTRASGPTVVATPAVTSLVSAKPIAPTPVIAPITSTPVKPTPVAPIEVQPPTVPVPVAPPAPPAISPEDQALIDMGLDPGFIAWLRSQKTAKAGGSIRMANGGSIPEGVIRHMKRAAIAARMHKAQGGRING